MIFRFLSSLPLIVLESDNDVPSLVIRALSLKTELLQYVRTSSWGCIMTAYSGVRDVIDMEIMLDDLTASEQQQSNCMFQLSLMLARIALERVSEDYKDQMAQALLGLIRSKPKSSIVQLFGVKRPTEAESPRVRASA